MNTETTLTPVASISTQEQDNLENFKRGVDNLLSRRSYFISQVLPKLKENQDYFVIKGRKFLAKGGSEKLASIYNLSAVFDRDGDTLEMLGNPKGLVAFICNLQNREGVTVGQGRGADTMEKNQNDPNKTIKISQKRAFVDAVIRSTGLSDIFSQDAETVYPTAPVNEHSYEDQRQWVQTIVGPEANEQKNEQPEQSHSQQAITDRQKKYLISLINAQALNSEDRDVRHAELETLTKYEASNLIQELSMAT